MGFLDFLNGEKKYDVIVREPSLSGKFAEVGIPAREGAQNIYVSPDTKARLDNINPELVGMVAESSRADYIIFVSKQDIDPEIGKIDKSNGEVGVLHDKNYPHYGNAFDGFRTKFEDAPAVIVPSAARNAYNEDASATLYEHENGQSYCTISLPDFDRTSDEYFKALSGVKGLTKTDDGEFVRTQINIPKSEAMDKALIASTIIHEAAGHCGSGHLGNAGRNDAYVLHEEQQADNAAAVITPLLFPETGEDAVAITNDARAIGSLTHDKMDHAINLGLYNDESVTSEQQIDSLGSVKQAIVNQVAEDMSSDIHEAKDMLASDPQLNHATIDKLNQAGEFKEDPVAQKNVDDYMKAGEARVPEYMGVEPEVPAKSNVLDAPLTVPPLQTQSLGM